MSIQKRKGKWERSSLGHIDSKRKAHPLNFKAKSIAAHHLISCEVASKLSSIRKKQIKYKGYDINHPYNLVFLPMIDQISCQYNVPLHKSGHTDSKLEAYYAEQSGSNINDEVSNLISERDKETNENKLSLLQGDIDMLNNLKGYHRIVGSMLAKTLKSLDCDDNSDDFVDSLDELSFDIATKLGRFQLHLISRGRHMQSGQDGCHYCRQDGNRNKHYHVTDNIPTQDYVKEYCYKGLRLYTVQEKA
ncbi:AHH domain-containing protein [Aliivibrio fischeri]|uniref:Uncharacterized protein n=1 Tax=Aliivibrio fischeri TaxID=668 RepID=A0A6N3YXC1_ALIFS|nr:AHH domain-containing protein [Aliivibrio fischeri]MUK37776.1 hypothetical protein [Aliivibrio fischeri]MUK45156.1 hypothetical protein [Aliivibrio fischeri]MUK80815.1 hypothetical protein [Aliivibrio fischeri]MUK84176.1 hypothetical protein [Aliivibrio fischeri]MUL06562.1 hypothetical protein [Aliivibrio fischeri]